MHAWSSGRSCTCRNEEFALDPYRFDDLEGWEQVLRRLGAGARGASDNRPCGARTLSRTGLQERLLRYLQARHRVAGAVRQAAHQGEAGNGNH